MTFRELSLTRIAPKAGRSMLPIALLAQLCATGSAHAQVTYTPRGVSSPPPEGFFSAETASGLCGLPDSGYIPENTTVRTNASGSVAGYCDWYSFGSTLTETRWLSHHKVTRVPPVGSSGYGFFYAPWHVQQYDSRTVSNGYFSFLMNTEGLHIFDFMSVGSPTNCNIPTNSPIVTLSINVVACKPVWNPVGNPVQTVHFPAAEVKVYIPSGPLRTALIGPNNEGAPQAISDLNTAVAGTGVSFRIVDEACGSGADCVNVSSGPSSIDGCADFTPGGFNLSNGAISAASSLRLNELYWPDATSERLRRTMNHELAHGLGLNHNQCARDRSVMATNLPPGMTPYEACTSHVGWVTSPTPTDRLPIIRSTYGNQVKATCGF